MRGIMQPKLITMDNKMKDIQPKNGKYFELEELQGYVDGLIDIIPFPDSNMIMVVNDEGRLFKEFNGMASLYCSIMFDNICTVYGDVVFCHTNLVP